MTPRPRSTFLGPFLPDRDVLVALARERLPLPAAPALAKTHSGKPCHQVELRGPHVPEGNREAVDLSVDDPEVMGDEALVRDVVLVESPSVLAHVEDAERVAARELLKPGDAHLDDEAAAGL